MQLKKILATGAALATAASLFALAPAAQATDADLTVTAAGTIAITAPTAKVNLGSLAAGVTAADAPNALGTVSVTDTRTGLVNNNWTVTVKSTAFSSTASGATPIAAASIGYKPGTVTSTDSLATGTPVLALSETVAAATVIRVGVGTNDASWTPKLTFTLGANTVAGTYTGTITHSLS